MNDDIGQVVRGEEPIRPAPLKTGRWWLVLGALAGMSLPAVGAVKAASVFTDHMVLQRDRAVPVWGTAEPGEKVIVRFAGQSKEAVAGEDGRWMLELDPLKASATPARMAVVSANGNQQSAIVDILVGDVWLCSGQSNMEMGLLECFNGTQEVMSATCPLIRLLPVPKGGANQPRDQLAAHWQVCSPAAMRSGFSAVGYYFGREIQKALAVPVGLIDSTVGGTPIESWTSPGPNQPGGDLFNAMIHPLIPFGLRGCIWYQGEYNLALFGDTLNYTAKMKALINRFRALWAEGELPFYYVQLAPLDWQAANYPNYKNLPEFWEAQTLVQSAVPHTGMAITTDITDDLKNIHPKDKKTVGLRLAALALHDAYGVADRVCRGPEFRSMRVQGSRVAVTFDHCDSGLKTRDGKAPDWFTLAGSNGVYQAATATIHGKDEVMFTADSVPRPVAVRFAWDCRAMPNLCNGAGYPANAFRTDKPDPNANMNLAMNKPVKVSGNTEGVMAPSYAVDGVTENWSGWHTAGAPQWLEVDLQKVYSVDRVKVVTYYDGARYYQYTVDVSVDGKQWKQVADMSKNTRVSTEAGETFTFPALKAQYVRITLLKNSANPGLHLNELMVFEAKTPAGAPK